MLINNCTVLAVITIPPHTHTRTHKHTRNVCIGLIFSELEIGPERPSSSSKITQLARCENKIKFIFVQLFHPSTHTLKENLSLSQHYHYLSNCIYTQRFCSMFTKLDKKYNRHVSLTQWCSQDLLLHIQSFPWSSVKSARL